jgi:hypothetical protein
MVRRSALGAAFILLAGLHAFASDAAAQPAAYIGGSAFADIKRFGSTTGIYYSAGDDFSLNGVGAGGSLRIGTSLHQRVSLELAIDAATTTKADLPNPYILAIFPQPPLLNTKASTQFVSVSTLLGYHPPASGRLRLGYLGGFSFVRGMYKTDYPSFSPLAVFSDPGFVLSSLPPSISGALPTILPPPGFRLGTATERELTTGVTLGFEAAITLTPRLAIVPDVRALAFSTPNYGPGVFLIRPGVGVRWSF